MSEPRLPFADGDPRNTRSYPKSWTSLQRHNLAIGLHPMGMDLAGTDETCGSCSHAMKHRVYKKCDLTDLTFGPGTDIRLSWPACVLWEDSDE